MSWKENLADYLLAIKLRHKQLQPTTAQHSTISNLGILLAAESIDHQQAVRHFAKEIEKNYPISTHIFGFVNKKLSEKVTFSFPHFSRTDMDWSGIPNNNKLELFLQRPYEVLVNFDLMNYNVIHYVSHMTLAKHKLALSPRFPHLYDIVIDRKDSMDLDSLVDKTLDIFGKITLA
ncbi:MAG: hypothetical protein HKN87_17920 [Saprospiraceae bacterium]|nr:hypothetical protein [Saprospiraceae bacterium]